MSDKNNLNSTERLLNNIRGNAPEPVRKVSVPNKRRLDHTSGQAISIKTNIKHGLTAGVFIRIDSVSLVLTGQKKQGAQKELVKWAQVPFPDHMDIKNNRFPSFLGATITSFLGKNKKASIWTVLDSKYLKLRNIIVPDLAESKIPNAALWGLKKEFEFDLEKEIFDYDFIGSTQIDGIKKKNLVAFTGEKKQIKFLKHLFSTAGYSLKGITTIPFALQNFISTSIVSADSSPVVMVNIAKYYSEITCLSQKGVFLTRIIKTGSYSLAEELIESKELIIDNGDITKILNSKMDRNSPEFDLIQHSADRLIGKILRTGEYCSNTYASNEPVSKYLFFGETDNCPAFMEYAAENIAGKIEIFKPCKDASSSLSIDLPENARQRNGIIPALGIALSGNKYTPNFLYTYIQKIRTLKYKKLNVIIAAACLACLVACAGVYGWFNSMETDELNKKAAIEKQLVQYNPVVTQNFLSSTIAKAKEKSDMISRYAHDFQSLAIIHEVCALTPQKISITSFDSDFSKADSSEDKKGKKEQIKKKKSLIIKGIVKAEFTELESNLSGYVLKLGDSPLFGDILLLDKKIEKKADFAILKFTADMEIL